ncbi:interaptin-like isoform X1 [Mytilus californianus]|uniref:interaptin-like isoform X1 n=1 Tax=Mytilus californianus TaxID=6549 RepID=UPI002245E5F6|nr:interaptin-like isoform X1 [Mytilus californianus]
MEKNYSSVGSRSDTEKENISLRSELTEALKNIEKMRQEYTDLSERYETGKIASKRTIESLQQEKICLEQVKVKLRAKFYQIQSDLNLFKSEQFHQQDSSHGTLENLLQQNRKLDNDRELFRGKISSLENDKIKLEDILNKSKEDNKKLQSDQDKLQDSILEKSNELKDSEVRLRKLETDILFFQHTKTENEQFKESLHELERIKREHDNLEKRYKKETSARMSSDNTSTKLKDENDRLRKDRNSARIELQRVLREKEEYYQNLNTEQVLAREELQNKEREKSELVALFKDKEDKGLQKIKLYEKEIDTLKSRCRDDNDKMRQSEYEIETLKSRREDDNDKLQRFEHEIDTLKSRNRDDNDKMRQMEREIEILISRLTVEKANQFSAYEVLQNKNDLETCKHQKKALEDERKELQNENIELGNELKSLNSKLEQFNDSTKNISNLKKQIKNLEERFEENNRENSSLHKEKKELKYTLQEKLSELKTLETRLSEEGSDQTLEQIGRGSIIRAQTMVNYDKLFAEKSEEVTKRVSELYENKWKVAMIELGENGGKKKNIEYLLKILENAYSFCERMEGRFTDEFEQAMLNGAANIKEVVDTTVFVRSILERLERCMNQMFLREYSEYQEHRTSEPVHTYITDDLSLSWFMVTRNPRVFISTTIPKESHPQLYDSYSTDGLEVDYVVLPIVKWSTNENKIIRKGIAAFK